MFRRAAVLIMTAGLTAGCANQNTSSSTSQTPTADEGMAIVESIKKNHPNARAGVILTVLDTHPLAMVGNIDVAGLEIGDVVSILDSNESVVGHGRVAKLFADRPNTVAISFNEAGRRPATGDVVVKF